MRSLDDLHAVFFDFEHQVDEHLAGRTTLAAEDPARPSTSPRPRAGGRGRLLAPLLVAAAVAAGAIGLVIVRGHGADDGSGLAPAGPEYSAHALTTTRIGKGQYAHSTTVAMTVDGKGHARTVQRTETWIAPSGSMWLAIQVGRRRSCEVSPFSGKPSFGGPTAAFVDSLPTGAEALQTYLEHHVSGSSSREEAVFVAVGDLLRVGDGLASARLRGAFVEVLSRTAGVRIDTTARDHSGRTAIRASFIDARRRPSSVASLYFEPRTYHLLQEGSISTGRPVPDADAPSVPYSVAPSTTRPVATDTGPGSVALFSDRTVVDRLPSTVTSSRCTRLTG